MLNITACLWSWLTLLLTLTIASEVEYCPVAYEGSRYELNCVCRIPSVQHFIEWTLTDTTKATDQNVTLTLCGTESPSCETFAKMDFSVTNSRTVDSFQSQLVSKNVTAKHRYLRFTCQMWDMNRDKKVLIKECQMAVYKPGLYQNYTGINLRDGRIKLHYSVRDSFPGISCQFSEKIDGKTTRINQPMKSTNEPDRYSSCEAIIYPLVKGEYTFDIEVKPNYPTALTGTSYSTGPLQVTKSLGMKIVQVSPATRCNESDTARVRCIFDWFEGPEPEVQFTYNGTSLKSNPSMDRFDNNDYTYKYVAEYRVPMIMFRALMVCKVGHTNGGQHSVLNDTKHLEFLFPPQTPVFLSQGHAIVKSLFDINRGENASLECHAPGGHPKVNFSRVDCMGNGYDISSTFNASDRVSFVVYGNSTYQKAFCVCYIHHDTDVCNQKREVKEVIYLRVERLGNPRDPEKLEVVNKLTPVYYIIVATLVLVFLPVLIATCVFIHKKGASLYYDYATKIRINRPQVENNPRSSINGPGTSSRHPGHTSQHTAPPPIPERKQPAPPVPPRPTGLSEERRGLGSGVGAIKYLNDQVWMDDPEIEISEQPVQTLTKMSSKKKIKRTDENVSVSSEDYLILLGPRLSSVGSQNDEVFSDTEEVYLKMGGVKEKRPDQNFHSLGFAPYSPKRTMPSARIWRSEDADLDNTGVKLLVGERNDPSVSHGAADTLAKHIGSRRRSPTRYVKLEVRRGRRDTGSESDARQQKDALLQESDPMLDINLGDSFDEDTPINVDISTLDIRPPDSGRFNLLADSHNSGPSSLTTRASRLENIYVDNTSIY